MLKIEDPNEAVKTTILLSLIEVARRFGIGKSLLYSVNKQSENLDTSPEKERRELVSSIESQLQLFLVTEIADMTGEYVAILSPFLLSLFLGQSKWMTEAPFHFSQLNLLDQQMLFDRMSIPLIVQLGLEVVADVLSILAQVYVGILPCKPETVKKLLVPFDNKTVLIAILTGFNACSLIIIAAVCLPTDI